MAAGCDIVLNCWAKMDDMQGIVAALPAMSDTTAKRLERALEGVGVIADSTPREELLRTRDAHGLYARFGFGPPDPGRQMVRAGKRRA